MKDLSLRRPLAAACALVASLALASSAGAAQAAPSLEDEILQSKCNACHSSKRLLSIDPKDLKAVLERMQKKDPDFITDVQREHVAEVAMQVLGDPAVVAMRQAWIEAVDRGRLLFKDVSLGAGAKSCASCHTPEKLRNVADAYPRFDLKLKRFVTLEEAVNLMVQEKLGGKAIGLTDQRMVDLLSYLKSLN